MPFHVDYRPQSLDAIIGNKKIVDSLRGLIEKENRPHSYLFQGPTGCGKSTFAIVLKNELGCSDEDFKEVNAASNRGIETAREIIEFCRYKPLTGDVRMVMIDEAGGTVKTFQEALLKILEDPPSYVYLVLCTTDPQKLLKTIRNRCTKFDVEPLSDRHIKILLMRVANEEGIELPSEVTKKIIEVADGCPREALVCLEKVSVADDMIAAASQLIPQESQIIDMCRAVLNRRSWKEISKIYREIDAEPESIRRSILGYLSSVLLNNGDERVAAAIAIFEETNVIASGKAALIRSIYDATHS